MAPTEPIAIRTSQNRHRSMSMSSASSSSAASSPEVTTPSSFTGGGMSPSTSPIMNYLQQHKSPKSASFPFRRPWQNPVFEEEEEDQDGPVTPSHHARSTSAGVNGRYAQPASPTEVNSHEKGAGLLRRLSLGGPTFVKPPTLDIPRSNSPPRAPPNSAISPGPRVVPPLTINRSRPVRRSATISSEKPARAPSPMGERILKGHFDGFN